MADIELRDHEKSAMVMRELAGLRKQVPGNAQPRHWPAKTTPAMPADAMADLRARVRALAQAIVDGGTMEPSKGSVAATERGGWGPSQRGRR
jgi:hypothetical protein